VSSARSGTPTAARRPGQYGFETIRRHAGYGLLCLALLVTLTVTVGMAAGFTSGAFVIAEVALIALMLTGGRAVTDRLDRRERGVAGEQRVGAVLEQLSDHGWLALHDVPTGRGNIDHVAIGPGGLIAVETKSHAGRRSVDRIDPAWLKQSYAQKCWLERVTGTKADGLLVFSSAYLDRHITRRRGVLILPARSLARALQRRRPVLSADEVQALYRKLCAALDSADAS